MPQPIQIRRTTSMAATPTSADGTTAHLLAGEPAVAIGAANATKMWVGDGTGNRLVLSTASADNPLFTQGYLLLTGGTVSGAVSWIGPPVNDEHLANKEYVDQTVAAGQLYQGTYDASTNTPDLSATANQPDVNGGFFIVSVAGTIPITVPGFSVPTPVNVGDHIIWNDSTNTFSVVAAGGMSQADADLRYLQLAGGTMATNAVITMGSGYIPTANTQQVATMNALASAVSGIMTTVMVDNVTVGGDGTATVTATTGPLHVLGVDGGTFT